MNHPDQQLVKISEAHDALQLARTLEDVTQIRDMAAALQRYIQQRRYTLEIQQDAAELKVRAERKAGEMLTKMRLAGGDRKSKTHHGFLKLADLGIDDHKSHRWQQIAGLPEEDFEGYVRDTRAAKQVPTTTGTLRVARARTPADPSEVLPDEGDFLADLFALQASGQTFGCIYADPPWTYDNQGTRASTRKHYATLTVEQLCALPIKSLAAPKAHLHLWTTNAFLFDCPALFDAWGFEFKGTFIWTKPQLGLGNYWRNSHELMLLGVRGGLTARNHGLSSWIQADRKTHSAKPEQIRDLIEQLSPGPYLELFGRAQAPGWVVWGNECFPRTGRLFKTGRQNSVHKPSQQTRRSHQEAKALSAL
jgi:N6-adenosine-specific RNA methylase IME4